LGERVEINYCTSLLQVGYIFDADYCSDCDRIYIFIKAADNYCHKWQLDDTINLPWPYFV